MAEGSTVPNTTNKGRIMWMEDIAVEEAARKAADDVLDGKITAEAGNRKAADATLDAKIDTKIAAEEAARKADVDALKAAIEEVKKLIK